MGALNSRPQESLERNCLGVYYLSRLLLGGTHIIPFNPHNSKNSMSSLIKGKETLAQKEISLSLGLGVAG
jgi:hypothetical protein